MKQFFSQWTWVALAGIMIFSWITRVHGLGQPAEFVFDERYHVPAIRLIAENDPRAFEWWHGPIYGESNHDWLHPPLAKYIQAGFYTLFGGDAFSWRIGSAVFGVVGVVLVFAISQLAFKKPALSLLAALLFSLDGLWLVQSRVAMNDVFVSVWLLAATTTYIWYRQKQRPEWLLLVGVFGGLGLATKWSGAWWILGLLVWEIGTTVKKHFRKTLPWKVFSLLLVPLAVYCLAFSPMFLQGKTLSHFVELHRQIALYQFHGTSAHEYQSEPWQWVLNLRPVWYWSGGEHQNIFAINNPLLAWFEVVALCWLGLTVWKKSVRSQSPLKLLLFLFGISFLPWLFFTRNSFYYHYTPATPFAAIFLAVFLDALYGARKKYLSPALLSCVVACIVWVFWLYYPRWTGLPVSSEFSQAVYALLPSWR